MTEEETIARALDAEAILNNALVKEAFETLDRKLYDAFKDAPARDKEGREYIHKMSKVLSDFRTHFEAIVRLGEDARAVIKDREKQSLLGRLVA